MGVVSQMDLIENEDDKIRSYSTLLSLLLDHRTSDWDLIRITKKERSDSLLKTEDKIIGFKITSDGKMSWGRVNKEGQLESEINSTPDPVLITLTELWKLQKKKWINQALLI